MFKLGSITVPFIAEGEGINIVGMLVGIFTALLGGWDTALQVLLILMSIDILSGIIKAWYVKELGGFSSKKFREGLLNKAAYFLVLILAYQIDVMLGNGEPIIRTGATIYYIAVEGSSLLENMGAMGVPIPSVIKKNLSVLKDLGDKTEEEN